MKDCKFCLENKSIKGKILAENELFYFVESIDPILKNAGMIISKRHVESPFDFTEQEWQTIKPLLAEARNILDKYNPDGYNIGWNVGQEAGQNIAHVHLHVIARFADEPLAKKGIRYAFKQENNRRPIQ